MSDQRTISSRAWLARRDRRRLRVTTCLVAVLLSLLGASPPSEARDLSRISVQAASPYPTCSVDVRGIPRFAELEAGLARGGQPSEDGFQFLRERGYRTVISFRRNPGERRLLERMGIDYVEIPMRAGLFGARTPDQRDVERFLSIVSDSSRKPIFIHCRRGRDRTGAMTAIYRIEACGWTNEEALEEMKAFGFSRHYRKLLRYVRTYMPR